MPYVKPHIYTVDIFFKHGSKYAFLLKSLLLKKMTKEKGKRKEGRRKEERKRN